jgi:hypothetical protein
MPRAAGCGYAQPGLSDRSRGLPQDWLTVASGLLWDQHPHGAVPSYTTGVTGLVARSAGTNSGVIVPQRSGAQHPPVARIAVKERVLAGIGRSADPLAMIEPLKTPRE